MTKINQIPFTSKLSRFRNLERRNKAFHALTPRQQRREIAYDALILLLTKKLYPAGYGHTDKNYWGGSLDKIVAPIRTSAQLQRAFCDSLNRNCQVCQRGALMVSQIRLGNQVDPLNDYYMDCGDATLVKGFSLSDFKMMEKVYEGHLTLGPYSRNTPEKMANILCNVISNGNYLRHDERDFVKKWKLNLKIKEK
jgi:hypothetical protein